MQPHQPPIRTEALPAVGGILGSDPAHFVVEEIPAYAPSGEGEHLYVRIEKVGENTADVARLLSRAANVPHQEVGFAGLKDRNAVTRQWFSLPARGAPPDAWNLPPSVKVLETSRHKNKLRTGHLIGNRFVLTLSDVPECGLERARAIASVLAEKGLGNYYGAQRFGRGGSNLEKALAWAQKPAGGDRRQKNRFDEKMLPSVLQSEAFTRYLSRRLDHPEALLDGEVVRLAGAGRHFVVERASDELPRLLEKDIVLTGPMWGPKTVQSTGPALELEKEALASLELSEEGLARLERAAPGARRDLLLFTEDLELDEPAPGTLEIAFSLPSGSYATQILREFTRQPWLELRGGS